MSRKGIEKIVTDQMSRAAQRIELSQIFKN